MTRISFYVLKSVNEHDRQVFACRLIEKAYKQGHQIYIHTDSAEHAEQLNQALWSFRADSFVPHQLASNTKGIEKCPVILGHDAPPPRMMSLLINFADEQPLFFSQFERVAEFVNENEEIKTAGRQRYRFYQQRGYELETVTV